MATVFFRISVLCMIIQRPKNKLEMRTNISYMRANTLPKITEKKKAQFALDCLFVLLHFFL